VCAARLQLLPAPSLGRNHPDEGVAQVETPGWVIILASGKTRYLYTASEKSFRYGGPQDSLRFSALYLVPRMDEPNLNGDLVQVSLAGTNPATLLEGVSSFNAQADGSILGARRTSRSGFDLLYLAPGKYGEARKLGSAFFFGQATVNGDGKQWAAIARTAVGGGWQVALGKLDADGMETLAVPAGAKPEKVWWTLDNPVLLVTQDDKPVMYELKLDNPARPWQKAPNYLSPDSEQFMLNKSETLEVQTEGGHGKPVTKVSKMWFTGDENPVATIEGFTPTRSTVTLRHRFLLMSGDLEGANVALTVDLATGEVLRTATDLHSPAQFLPAPPQSWLVTTVENVRG